MSESLLKKAEDLAAKVGSDVETVFDEFAAWVEGKKAVEAPKEEAAETSTASTDSTSNTTEGTSTEQSTPDTASAEAPKAE